MSNAAVPPLDDRAIIDLREIWALADEMNAVEFPEVAEALIDLGRELADCPGPRTRPGPGRQQSPAGTGGVSAHV